MKKEDIEVKPVQDIPNWASLPLKDRMERGKELQGSWMMEVLRSAEVTITAKKVEGLDNEDTEERIKAIAHMAGLLSVQRMITSSSMLLILSRLAISHLNVSIEEAVSFMWERWGEDLKDAGITQHQCQEIILDVLEGNQSGDPHVAN